MKTFLWGAVALLWLGMLASTIQASIEATSVVNHKRSLKDSAAPRWASDCATTTFRMANNRVFLAADVFKYTRLSTGQGTNDCMALCRAYDECWSFNYDKTRKFCYLISQDGEELKKKRKYSWSSGSKVCVDHSTNDPWNNDEIDSSTLQATNLELFQTPIANPGARASSASSVWHFGATWTPAAGIKLNGAATPYYYLKCGPDNDDWHCDEQNAAWTSPKLTKPQLEPNKEAFDTLLPLGSVKCYVETRSNGITLSCSRAATYTFYTASLCAPTLSSPGWLPDFSVDKSFIYGTLTANTAPACSTDSNFYLKVVADGADCSSTNLGSQSITFPGGYAANITSGSYVASVSAGPWGGNYTLYAVAEDSSGILCSEGADIFYNICFPGRATVQVLGRGTVRMDEIHVGDKILAVTKDGKLEWSEVFFFGRRQADIEAQYHKLTAKSSIDGTLGELTMSPTHFVSVTTDYNGYCNGNSDAKPPMWSSHKMILAKDVRPGMVLWQSSAQDLFGSVTPSCVISNEYVTEKGAYDPFIRDRALIVDSFAASPHVRWTALALYWLLPTWVQPHLPAIYDLMMAPLFWTYKVIGADIIDNLTQTFFFKGFLVGPQCPGGAFYCLGGNALLAMHVTLGLSITKFVHGLVNKALKLPSKKV